MSALPSPWQGSDPAASTCSIERHYCALRASSAVCGAFQSYFLLDMSVGGSNQIHDSSEPWAATVGCAGPEQKTEGSTR